MSYTIPYVVESTPRGERVTDVFSRLLNERIVLLGTPIDDGVATAIIAQLLHLAADRPDQSIHLYINSPGGSYAAALAIYDTMQYISAPVATLCVGLAGDAAAVVLAGGAAGQRAMLEHAQVVLRQPHASVSRGSLTDLALDAAEVSRLRTQVDGVLARHTGRDPEQVHHDTDRVLRLDAAAAVAYGVVDSVIGASGGAQRDPGHALHPGAGRDSQAVS